MNYLDALQDVYIQQIVTTKPGNIRDTNDGQTDQQLVENDVIHTQSDALRQDDTRQIEDGKSTPEDPEKVYGRPIHHGQSHAKTSELGDSGETEVKYIDAGAAKQVDIGQIQDRQTDVEASEQDGIGQICGKIDEQLVENDVIHTQSDALRQADTRQIEDGKSTPEDPEKVYGRPIHHGQSHAKTSELGDSGETEVKYIDAGAAKQVDIGQIQDRQTDVEASEQDGIGQICGKIDEQLVENDVIHTQSDALRQDDTRQIEDGKSTPEDPEKVYGRPIHHGQSHAKTSELGDSGETEVKYIDAGAAKQVDIGQIQDRQTDVEASEQDGIGQICGKIDEQLVENDVIHTQSDALRQDDTRQIEDGKSTPEDPEKVYGRPIHHGQSHAKTSELGDSGETEVKYIDAGAAKQVDIGQIQDRQTDVEASEQDGIGQICGKIDEQLVENDVIHTQSDALRQDDTRQIEDGKSTPEDGKPTPEDPKKYSIAQRETVQTYMDNFLPGNLGKSAEEHSDLNFQHDYLKQREAKHADVSLFEEDLNVVPSSVCSSDADDNYAVYSPLIDIVKLNSAKNESETGEKDWGVSEIKNIKRMKTRPSDTQHFEKELDGQRDRKYFGHIGAEQLNVIYFDPDDIVSREKGETATSFDYEAVDLNSALQTDAEEVTILENEINLPPLSNSDSDNSTTETPLKHSKDLDNPEIHITYIQHTKFYGVQAKKKKNTRVFNKKSSCYYCGTLTTNISKHYTCHHSKEDRVTHILSLKEEKQFKASRIEWEILRNLGNHVHNKKVVANRCGELLVTRRKNKEVFSVSDYTPCPLCKGWFLKSALYTHANYRCIVKPEDKMRTASLLIKSNEHKFDDVCNSKLDTVFRSMRQDDVTKLAEKDYIICKIGEFYLEKHSRNQLRCKNFVSKNMRMAAKLLLKVHEIDNTEKDLESYITPEKFAVVKQAAIALAGNNDNDFTDVPCPSTIKNIGYEIKKYAELKEEIGITERNKEKIKEAKYFIKLYKRNWKVISNSAIKQLQERQFNQEIQLPTGDEIKELTDEIKTNLEASLKSRDYKCIVELVQSRLILFNKRRPGEIEKVKIEDYGKRSNNDSVLSDVVMSTLTDLEKKLLATHDIITVSGKRSHAVPIIIPPDCVEALAVLANKERRINAGIKSTNPYIFANTGDGVFRAVNSLRGVLMRSKLATIMNPLKHIKATTLRKYMATNCQLLNLNESELDWVVRHLGHSKLTHMNNYRLSSSTIERTKIAKLLVILDNNLVTSAQGSNLSDENVDEIILKTMSKTPHNADADSDFHNDDDELSTDEDDPVSSPSVLHSSHKGDESLQSVSPIPESDSDIEVQVGKGGKKKRIILTDSDSDSPCKKVCQERRNIKWGESDIAILFRKFGCLIRKGLYPSFAQIRTVQDEYPQLRKRTLAQIKAKCAHLILKRK